ncbi:hypothetical protein SH139x_003553 [Planctomycetaceae bacterium SH139]
MFTTPLGRNLSQSLCIAALFFAGGDTKGQTVLSGREALAARTTAAADSLDPQRLPDLAEAASALRSEYQDLVNYLERTSDPIIVGTWLNYIRFDEVLAAMSEEGSRRLLTERLQALYWRLARNSPGLEREPIVQFRQQARRYATLLRLGDDREAVRRIESALSRIAEILRLPAGPLPAADAELLTYNLRFVAASGFAPELVAAIRNHFSQPNVQLLVGESAVNEFVQRPVYNTGPSNECILGTRVISDTVLAGSLSARLIPASNAAKVGLSLLARFDSLGTGYQKKIRVKTRGFGDVRSELTLMLDTNGVTASPVTTFANLDSQILGISHPLRIVRRIAARKAAEQKPLSNKIASQRLADRVGEQFAEQLGQQLSGGNDLAGAFDSDLLQRFDIAVPGRQWSSTSEFVKLALMVRNQDQISTEVVPAPAPSSEDIIVRVHESAIKNVTATVLSERTLSDVEFTSFLSELLPDGWRPPAATGKQDGETAGSGSQNEETAEDVENDSREQSSKAPINITFHPTRPFVFELRDGSIRLGIFGLKFAQGGDETRAMEISAVYTPQRTQDGDFKLVRNEEVDIAFGPRGGGGVVASILRTNIRLRFEEIFPAEIPLEPFPLPVSPEMAASNPTAPPRTLVPTAIEAEDGWLVMHFRIRGGG